MEDQKIQDNIDLIPDDISSENLDIIKDAMKAGLMYGHRKSKTVPQFKPYIHSTRNGIELIDLSQTLSALDSAVQFMNEKIKNNGLILIVASQPAAREAIENMAKKFNFCFINDRWIGGSLTNFKVISQRIEYFKKVKSDFEKGNFEKYTKKERVVINRNIERMKKMFSGMENMTRLPDLIFVIDPSLKGHTTAVREARRMKIPTVAILDSDDNPDFVNYPIPANDHAKMSIDWIINKISEKLSDTNIQIGTNDTNNTNKN